jgi:eukaryotic-like serine/threonine-protein kinase
MGEVYRARDPNLRRDVAIKVLPAGLIDSSEYVARFRREAQLLAALNHPNIAAIYGLEEDAIVMELVEGETIASRLREGPLPFELVVRYGTEIAAALAAAHARGIIHRDLKPGNVMLTKSGVKVLDFGLAKMAQADETLTSSHVIQGTPAYMPPEQLAGKPCDARTDIYALGLLLYEMASGKRFGQSEPTGSESLPEPFAQVIARCLQKNPDERWQSAQDVVWALEPSSAASGQASQARSSHRRLPWLVAGGALFMFGLLAIAAMLRSPPAQALRALSIVAPPDHSIVEAAISPDGSRVAFTLINSSRKRQLCIRPLDSVQHHVLPGTDGASNAFWSPDGRNVGFFAEQKLKRIPIDANAATVQVLADAPDGRGGAWNADNVIVFAPNIEDGLYRVPSAGGEVAPFTRLDRANLENSHRWPQFLPDGSTVIFLARASAADKQGIYAATLSSRERKLLFRTPYAAIYAPSKQGGSILFADGDVLMSRRFDPRRLQFSEEAKPITNPIGVFDNRPYVSAGNGTLVYQGREQPAGTLNWHDRNGKPFALPLREASWGYLRVSTDDRYALTVRVDPRVGSGDVWIADLQRGTEVRFTSHPAYEWMPVWSPDATQIAFASNRNGPLDLYVKPMSGSEDERMVLASANRKIPTDWSRDGRWLVFQEQSADKQFGLYALPLGAKSEPIVLVDSEFDEIQGAVSPDGRWLAYASNDTGSYEVYVRTFKPGTRTAVASTRISASGGMHPQWRRDGKELFYIARSGHLASASVNPRAADFTAGRPDELIALGARFHFPSLLSRYAISRDGERVLFVGPGDDVLPSPLTVLLGWSR